MRHLTIAALAAAILTAMLIPAGASAQRSPSICDRHPSAPICKRIERLNDKRDRSPSRGGNSACRLATSRYSSALAVSNRARKKQAGAKSALKKAKGKKAKAKKAKALKRAKAASKKAKKTAAARLKAKKTACA